MIKEIILAAAITTNFFGQTTPPPAPQAGCQKIFMPMIRGENGAQSFTGNGNEIINVTLTTGTKTISVTQCGTAKVEIYHAVSGNRAGQISGTNDFNGTIRIVHAGEYLLSIESNNGWTVTIN